MPPGLHHRRGALGQRAWLGGRHGDPGEKGGRKSKTVLKELLSVPLGGAQEPLHCESSMALVESKLRLGQLPGFQLQAVQDWLGHCE